MKEKKVLQDRLPIVIKQRRLLEEKLARLEGGQVPTTLPEVSPVKRTYVRRGSGPRPVPPRPPKPPPPPSPPRIIKYIVHHSWFFSIYWLDVRLVSHAVARTFNVRREVLAMIGRLAFSRKTGFLSRALRSSTRSQFDKQLPFFASVNGFGFRSDGGIVFIYNTYKLNHVFQRRWWFYELTICT